ncbi:9370_t:CDS:2 [Funneliformis geosporum]|uniref:9370_t:CDS:1 n=1 Tax=Funneliformis geosporum TaxID=1117311 RepID=A0A9W4X0J2_9GLOM|nr:9370_t:CDS:2 [Funneliformis geosporum]
MITPVFTITQDPNLVIIVIKTPYIKVSDIELYCEGSDFTFYAKPYYLRLHFPGNLVDDDRVNASYDIAAGEMNLKIPKETPGMEFPDLDLLTKLLAPKSVKKIPEKPLIEVIEGDNNDEVNHENNEFIRLFEKENEQKLYEDNNEDFLIRELNSESNNNHNEKQKSKPLIQEIFDGKINDENEAKRIYNLLEEGKIFIKAVYKLIQYLTLNLYLANAYDWELPQQELLSTAKYGFNGLYSGYFMHVQETCNEIIDITNPEKSTPESRRKDRINAENNKFDPDHYIADFMSAEEIKYLIKSKTLWWKELKRLQNNDKNETTVNETVSTIERQDTSAPPTTNDVTNDVLAVLKFTEKENMIMRNLPNKQYLLENIESIYYGLVDLLFAYSYNHRVFEGENTVESAWIIGKISPTISCLEQFNSLEEIMKTLYRRSLAYPLRRNYELTEKCQDDVYVLFKLGRRAILKVLLELKDLFDHHDVYYIYSKIWLDDYCIWCQTKASDKIIRSLAHKLHHYKVLKSDIGWNLEEYEQIALEDAQDQAII